MMTMYAMRIFFIQFLLEDSIRFSTPYESLDFFLLVFSLLLIAAAGNIINDYFDIKADRINKPERVIVSVKIKRRWAILIHWIFNVIAFAIACYLSWKHHSFLYVAIHLLYINLLWIYSTSLKRKFFIGNVVIALLTGFIPVFVSLYFLNVFHFGYQSSSWYTVIVNAVSDYFYFNPTEEELGKLILNFGLGMGFFAFLSNLAREIVKDIEDVKGDIELRAKTVPIVWGEQKSSLLVAAVLAFTLVVYFYFIFSPDWLPRVDKWFLFAPISFALFVELVAICILFSSLDKRLRLTNTLLKLSMFFGLFTPIYIVIIHAL